MKTFELSKDSWHYRIVTVYTSCNEWEINRGYVDFCAYLRYLFFGMFWILTIIAIVSLLSFGFVLVPLIYFVSMFELGAHLPPLEISAILSVDFTVALMTMFAVIQSSENPITLKRFRLDPNREPGFWTLAYRKFKDKTCFKITVV